MKSLLISFICLFMIFGSSSCHGGHMVKKLNANYTDAIFVKGIQTIPGNIQCEYYDLGGEGIAFHDTDSINSGSGELNKGADYLSKFRAQEAVDISYTKFHDSIDNSKFNIIQPSEGQLYVGWTEPGEWIRYTVDVKTAGTYSIGIMYTANAKGQIALVTDENISTGPMNVLSTYDSQDPISWRQWHHWNYLDSIGKIDLKKGLQTLTLHTVKRGQMNYDFLSFNLVTSNHNSIH